LRKLAIGGSAAIIGLFLIGVAAVAAIVDPFTQTELDTNWEADRRFPSDGVTSVSAFGRDNVARLGIDSTETTPSENPFTRTEGIKTVGAQNFGLEVQVDLYLDPDWEDKAVRAGFWVVGDNGAGARDELYGIIEFVNNEPCPESDCTNQANITDHEGWRYWTSPVGWTNLDSPFQYGEWVTLKIILDPIAEQYTFFINGEQVASGPGGQNFIRELFLNSYNYGLDNFPELTSESYAAHWHAATATSKDECQNGGWEDLFDADGDAFKNQGDCIQYVSTMLKTVVVTPEDMATSLAEVFADPTSWFFYNDENDTIDDSLGSFVSGPETPPEGSGSVEISVTGAQRRNLATYQFAGTALADITQLKFSTYNPSAGNGGSPNRSGYLNFNVSFDGNDTWQRRLFYVPSQNGTVLQDTWQQWDAIAGGTALWGWSGFEAAGNQWPDGNTSPLRTWADLLASFPDIQIRDTDSWLGIRVGEPYADGYTENIDAFVFGTGAVVRTWDFEP
jgi:hypothetical protein